MKDENEIDELLKIAVEADLEGLDFVSQFTYDQIAASYNGIGPSFLSAEKRRKLSRYLALFAPAAVIHDMRYTLSDGTRRAFNYANFEFRENCIALAEKAYGLLNWRRYRAYVVAEALFAGVSSQGGWVAWCEAFRDRATKEVK